MRRKRDPRLSLVASVALLIGIPVFSDQVNSHDWYPLECCHALDCAPVESVEILTPASADGLPAMVVTTKSGTVIVPASFPRRESKDNRIHACMTREPTGRMRLLCIFVPPPS